MSWNVLMVTLSFILLPSVTLGQRPSVIRESVYGAAQLLFAAHVGRVGISLDQFE